MGSQLTEETELAGAWSKRCIRKAKMFLRQWRTIDRNHDNKIYWKEMWGAAVKRWRAHGTSWKHINSRKARAHRWFRRHAGKKGYISLKKTWNKSPIRGNCPKAH